MNKIILEDGYKFCTGCTKPFKINHSKKVSCSIKCKEQTIKYRVCDTCNNFFRVRGNKRFCNFKCFRTIVNRTERLRNEELKQYDNNQTRTKTQRQDNEIVTRVSL